MVLELDKARDRHRDKRMMDDGWTEYATIQRKYTGYSVATSVVVPVILTIDVGTVQPILDVLTASIIEI